MNPWVWLAEHPLELALVSSKCPCWSLSLTRAGATPCAPGLWSVTQV